MTMDHVSIPIRVENSLVTLGQEFHAPIQTSSQPGLPPIENVLMDNGKVELGQMVSRVASPTTVGGGVCDSDGVSYSDSPSASIVPNNSWFDEAEREEEGQEFTLVLSKAQRKSRSQAARSGSQEAYLRRTKEISQ